MDIRTGSQYDLPTAVTFLILGLGIGSLAAIVFSPRSERPLMLRASLQRAS